MPNSDDSGGPPDYTGSLPGDSSSGSWWDSVKNWWNGGYNNSGNQPSGGGGGGGFAPGTKVTSTASQVLPWLQFAQGIIESQKSGKFVTPPMSPEQSAMLDWAMNYLTTTPNTGAMAIPLLQNYLANPDTLDVAALKRGEVGFHPGNRNMVDLATLLKGAGVPTNATGMPEDTTGWGGLGGAIGGGSPLKIGGADERRTSPAWPTRAGRLT